MSWVIFLIAYVNLEDGDSTMMWVSFGCAINVFATAIGESTLIGYIKSIP